MRDRPARVFGSYVASISATRLVTRCFDVRRVVDQVHASGNETWPGSRPMTSAGPAASPSARDERRRAPSRVRCVRVNSSLRIRTTSIRQAGVAERRRAAARAKNNLADQLTAFSSARLASSREDGCRRASRPGRVRITASSRPPAAGGAPSANPASDAPPILAPSGCASSGVATPPPGTRCAQTRVSAGSGACFAAAGRRTSSSQRRVRTRDVSRTARSLLHAAFEIVDLTAQTLRLPPSSARRALDSSRLRVAPALDAARRARVRRAGTRRRRNTSGGREARATPRRRGARGTPPGRTVPSVRPRRLRSSSSAAASGCSRVRSSGGDGSQSNSSRRSKER